jgi:CTLH/CRA C-terminal to LisH motif domain
MVSARKRAACHALRQEFVELVRAERQLEAIRYAQQHLAPWAGTYMAEVQRALALLALRAETKCYPHRSLFEDGQWDGLIDSFRKELYRLNSLTAESVLSVHLQVLAAEDGLGVSPYRLQQPLRCSCVIRGRRCNSSRRFCGEQAGWGGARLFLFSAHMAGGYGGGSLGTPHHGSAVLLRIGCGA